MEKKHECLKCNKKYSSYKSLWRHNNEHHTNILTEKTFICEKCNNNLSCRQSKYKHQKICKIINNNNIEIEKIKLEQLKEEKDKIKEELKLIKLKLKLEKTKKLDTKTFKSLNKMLMERSFNMKNSNIINSNNVNSNNSTNIQNNINIIGFGKEEITDIISNKDKKIIMNSGPYCLEKLIEISNCGNYNQTKNLVITNLKDNYAYKYDKKLGYFVTTSKTSALNDLINNRVNDIEIIYDELVNSSKINTFMKDKVCAFLKKINENNKFINEEENKSYDTYKDYKKEKILVLLYDNQDKITKDITLLFTN